MCVCMCVCEYECVYVYECICVMHICECVACVSMNEYMCLCVCVCATYIVCVDEAKGTPSGLREGAVLAAEQGPKPASLTMFVLAILASSTLRREKEDPCN